MKNNLLTNHILIILSIIILVASTLQSTVHQNSGASKASLLITNLNQSKDSTGTFENNSNKNESSSFLKKIKSATSTISKTTIVNKNLFSPFLIENKNLNNRLNEDLNKFAAYSKLISQLMNSIVNKELGVTKMKDKLNETKSEIVKINYVNILDDIAQQMIKKIQDAHSIIEITGERIEEIFQAYLRSNLTDQNNQNSLGCCDFYNNHQSSTSTKQMKIDDLKKMINFNNVYDDNKLLNELKIKEQQIKNENYHFEKRFNSWINDQYSCDIMDINDDHNLKSHFFNPSGSNLTEQFRKNLQQNPNIKWQYFMSFLGIHIEYPSFLPPNNYCFLHNLVTQFPVNRSRSSQEERLFSNNYNNGPKRLNNKFKLNFQNKKQDLIYHHRKAYMELNQLFAQRHKENLLATALPQPKLVVIVIDRGSALTEHQLNIAKSVAKYIVNSLSHQDKVGIVDLTSMAYYPNSETCSYNFELAFANYETKTFYENYIDDMDRSYNSTNHYLGFKKAFEIIAANYHSFKTEIKSEPEIFIAYISRGLLASLVDAKPVMKLIADELKNCSYTFIINTYALIDERIPIMLETIFLKQIASMNFKKFNVDAPDYNRIRPGIMVALNSPENLRYTLNGIYSVLKQEQDSESIESYDFESNPYISLPYFDFISKDTHISLSKSYHYHDRLIGIVGVDLSFFDLAEDIIHFNQPDSYAFLMDANSGKLLYHPIFVNYFQKNFRQSNQKFNSYSNYDNYYQKNSYVNVEHIEQIDGFYPTVKQKIMTQFSGTYSIRLNYNNIMSKPINKTDQQWLNDHQRLLLLNKYTNVVYHWRRILSTPYIIVIVGYQSQESKPFVGGQFEKVSFDDGISKIVHPIKEKQQKYKFVNHRLDNPQKKQLKLCKYFNQLATIETSTIYLSPNAFRDPYNFQIDSDSYDSVQHYMDYLTDQTGTIPNPGVNDDVRNDVNIINFLTDFWRQVLEESETTSKYVVRKYIATNSGIFLLYPGSLLDQSFQPKTRQWYIRAVSNPGKMIFIPPYSDTGGSGNIVTISKAIFDGKSQDKVWAVMGIDLTLGYFNKIINEMVPICAQEQKTSCFLMDDYGYLIVHSSFSKPDLMLYIDPQHITHKEPHMMNHLLNHKNFVQKSVCNSFTDRTIQRYYRFNTSSTNIVTQIVRNDNNNSSCSKYNIVSLDDTNIFFGIVDHSCDNFTTFCPCSLMDRLCLNCHRMEQTDCECPCECPLVMNLCDGQLIEKEDQHPICPIQSDRLKEPNVPKHLFDSLNQCIDNECSKKLSENDCKGVLGCEWCSIENGQPMKKPFCSNLNFCFNGIYGSKNPYMTNSNFNNFNYNNHERKLQSNPFGSLTTILFLCFLVLTFSVSCFNFHSNRDYGTPYLNSNQNDHQVLQPSNDNAMDSNDNDNNQQNNNNNDDDNNREAVASYLQALINTNQGRNLDSPYQYNSNYSFNRRRAETESDFGYSTMTANDDSEPNGPIYIDPNIIRSNKMKTLKPAKVSSLVSVSSVMSNDEISSSSSSIVSRPSTSFSMNETINTKLPPPPLIPGTKSKRTRSKQKFNEEMKMKKQENCTILEEEPSTLSLNDINLIQT